MKKFNKYIKMSDKEIMKELRSLEIEMKFSTCKNFKPIPNSDIEEIYNNNGIVDVDNYEILVMADMGGIIKDKDGNAVDPDDKEAMKNGIRSESTPFFLAIHKTYKNVVTLCSQFNHMDDETAEKLRQGNEDFELGRVVSELVDKYHPKFKISQDIIKNNSVN